MCVCVRVLVYCMYWCIVGIGLGKGSSLKPRRDDGKTATPSTPQLHPTDVLSSVHYFLYELGASTVLTPLQCLAACVAAIGHDFKHPGTNNAFQVHVDRLGWFGMAWNGLEWIGLDWIG